MNVGVDLIEVDDGLLPAQMLKKKNQTDQTHGWKLEGGKTQSHGNSTAARGRNRIRQERTRGGGGHAQQGGDLVDDPVGVVAEEGDDLGDEARGAPLVLQHLQLLELLVHQTLDRDESTD